MGAEHNRTSFCLENVAKKCKGKKNPKHRCLTNGRSWKAERDLQTVGETWFATSACTGHFNAGSQCIGARVTAIIIYRSMPEREGNLVQHNLT